MWSEVCVSLTSVCPAVSLFSSAVSQQGGRGEGRTEPCRALQWAAFPSGENLSGVPGCDLNGCRGLGGAWCSSAVAWGGLQQCEPCVCRGDMRTSGLCPCEPGSHCRPLKILPHQPLAPWHFLPGEFRRGSALRFLDLWSLHTSRAAQEQGDSETQEAFCKGPVSMPGTWNG